MSSDPIINKVDETFGNKLAEVIKAYVQELVNHELDVITDSDWFSDKIYEAVDAVRDSKNV
jgi:hypothetical protein